MRYLLFFILMLVAFSGFGQHELKTSTDRYSLQFGYGIKATIEFNKGKSEPWFIYRVASTAGISSDFLSSNVHPSVNAEVQLYNGGLGSKEVKLCKMPTIDLIIAGTVTAGNTDNLWLQNKELLTNRNAPLYYFADFITPSLQNPFKRSASLGTNFIFSSDQNKSFQRVGFLNLHLEDFQLSYYNDGGFLMSELNLGDRRDRYYTGGLVLSLNLDRNRDLRLNQIELSYHKHTGYTRNAFEVSNKMFLAFMDYHKPGQEEFNKSVWSVSLGNIDTGIAFSGRLYNQSFLDLQHLIHYSLYNTYHIVPGTPFISAASNYSYSSTTLGLK